MDFWLTDRYLNSRGSFKVLFQSPQPYARENLAVHDDNYERKLNSIAKLIFSCEYIILNKNLLLIIIYRNYLDIRELRKYFGMLTIENNSKGIV